MADISQIYPATDKLVVTSTYALNNQPYVPLIIWEIAVAIAVAFFVLSFVYKLRGAEGRVSSERIAFSMISTVVCGITAWLSVQIAVPSSTAQSMTDIANGTQLVIVQNYTVYSQIEIVVLFVVFAVISFANFVYTVTQPELMKPELDDLKGSQQTKSRMEKSKVENKEEE